MKDNRFWNLESFLDSLIVELDKAQDTLALKGVNRPLTYTVKDMALDLQIFPVYDGDTIQFATARPGESGASKVSIQLGSITDRQIRETTKTPLSKDDLDIDTLELPKEAKRNLKKIGVNSVEDLRRMETKNVDLGKAAKEKLDYKDLASAITKSRRMAQQPAVRGLSLAQGREGYTLALDGKNLFTEGEEEGFPRALLNRNPVKVISATPESIELAIDPAGLRRGINDITVALDRHSVIRMDLEV